MVLKLNLPDDLVSRLCGTDDGNEVPELPAEFYEEIAKRLSPKQAKASYEFLSVSQEVLTHLTVALIVAMATRDPEMISDIESNRAVSGAELIFLERLRQQTQEGYSDKRDDRHEWFQLMKGASCYLQAAGFILEGDTPEGARNDLCELGAWPWDNDYFKVDADPIRSLVKSGALIAAEIDRLTRKRLAEAK